MGVPLGLLDWDLNTDGHYDLVIIGGGINGCALAREAARAGLRTLLLERRDFGAGTTSRSTRLIHGGLRYLERFDLSLVRASLRDRASLLREFPGQVQPLPFLLPVYSDDSRPPWYVGSGLLLYRLLGAGGQLPPPRRLPLDECGRLVPGLDRKGLRACFEYHDCQAVYPERLALEMALQAEDAGADIRNHACVKGFLTRRSRVIGLQFKGAGGEGEVRSALVVNAAGAWADEVLARVGRQPMRPLLTLINGAHVVVPRLEAAPSHAVYREARSDRRPFFIVPWRGLHLIGTTEVRSVDGPDRATPGEEEVRYLLDETAALLPEAGVARDSVLYAYSGSRPVLKTEGTDLSRASRGDAIVDHQRRDGIGGLVTMAGGKLTTAQSFARRTLSRVAAMLGRPLTPVAPPAPDDVSASQGNGASLSRLSAVYGPRAAQVQRFLSSSPGFAEPLAPGCEVACGEVLRAVREERALTLGDILLRRTGAAFAAGYEPGWACAAAEVAAEQLGWNEAGIATAVADFEAELSQTLVRV